MAGRYRNSWPDKPKYADVQLDLQAVLKKQPVTAFKSSSLYRLKKFVIRQPWISAFVLTTVISITSGVAGITLALFETEQQRRIAERASENAKKYAEGLEQVVIFQSERLKEIDPVMLGLQIRKQVVKHLKTEETDSQLIPLSVFEQLNYTDIGLNALSETIFEQSINAINIQFHKQPETRASLLQSTARAMLELGLIKRGLDVQAMAVAVYQEHFGAEHQKTLNSKSYLSEGYFRLSEFDKAAEIARNVLEQQKLILGQEHPDILVTMNNYGLILTAQNKLMEAEQIFLESLSSPAAVNTPLSYSKLELNNNLGITYYYLDRLDQSLHHIGVAREGHRQLDGEESIKYVTNSLNYAAVLQRVGEKKQAQEVFEATARLAEKVLGTEHPNTLVNKGNYANLLIEMGDYDKAAILLRECIEVGIRTLGKRHSSVIIWHDSIASTLFYSGRLEESEQYYREALKLSVETIGETHLSTIDTKEKLARVLQAKGQFSEAERLFNSVYDALVETEMTKHRQFLSVQNGIAILYRETNRLEESAKKFEQLFDSAKVLLTDKNFELASYRMEYGITLLKLGRFEKSLLLLEPAQAKLLELLGEQHRLVKKATSHLDDLYQQLFDVTQDKQYQEKRELL